MTADAHNWVHGPGTDYRYDIAGNMTHDATENVNLSYDQENRITGANGYGYIYDGDGNRVEKVTPPSNPASGTLYWSMTPGIVAESDLTGAITSEYIFFDGERVARRDGPNGTGGVFYYFSDHLKTASIITDSAGVIKAESDYYPWGGELQFVNNDSNHYKFTSKERDSETGLDYFGARYYSNGLGRWVSADWNSTPVPVPYADFEDPQSLNHYTYVRNIPTSDVDVDGHVCQCFRGGCYSKEHAESIQKTGDGLAADVRRILNHPAVQAYLLVLTFEFGGSEEGGAAEGAAAGTEKAAADAAANATKNQAVNSAAKSTADAAQAGGRDSGTAAAMQTADGEIVTGTSAGKGGTPEPNHPEVQQALDKVPQPSPYHGGCAEVSCLNAAKNAGKNVRGAKMATAKIRRPGHPAHGQPNPPCATCQNVMQQMGVTNANGK